MIALKIFSGLLLLLLVVGDSHQMLSLLKTFLLQDYDRTVRPVHNHQNSTTVIVHMLLKFFELDIHMNMLTIDAWMLLIWHDDHLTWDPLNFDGLKVVRMSGDDIWVPDLSVYNRNDQSGSPTLVSWATCTISFTGQVKCVVPTRQSSLCVPDLTLYPYDTQNCTIRIGSWVYTGEEIDLMVAAIPTNVEDMVPNGQWRLVTVDAIRHDGRYDRYPNNTYPSLLYHFYVERLTGAHAASVILPAVALILVALATFLIDPSQSSRLGVCCAHLICQFLYLENLSWMLPLNGDKTPLILLFARDSLLLSSFMLIFAIVLHVLLRYASKSSPYCVSYIVQFALNCCPGLYTLLIEDTSPRGVALRDDDDKIRIINTNGDETTADVQSFRGAHQQDWLIFVKILNILCFASYTIAYICMFVVFKL